MFCRHIVANPKNNLSDGPLIKTLEGTLYCSSSFRTSAIQYPVPRAVSINTTTTAVTIRQLY